MTRGKSLGGITASATIATTISLPKSKSNISGSVRPNVGDTPQAFPVQKELRATRSADLVHVVGVDANPVLDGTRRSGCGRRDGLLLVVVGHALLERFHALGDVAHDVRDLALAAEQQERDRNEQHPVPNAKATHGRFPNTPTPPGVSRRRTLLRPQT